MLVNGDTIIRCLEPVAPLKAGKLYFANPEPFPEEQIYIHSCARIITVLEGKKRLEFAQDGKRRNLCLEPGDFLIAHPGGWTVEHWEEPHRMISVAFWKDFVRVIHLAHDGRPPYPPPPDEFHHTPEPLTEAGKYMLAALLATARDVDYVRCNLAALFGVITEMLNSERSALSRRELDWKHVLELIRLNFTFDIVRQDIAEMAGIHPARLSRLLKFYCGRSFNECVNEMRLEYAAELLQEGGLTISEIAERCGYHYTNYFIRMFRKRFGTTPAACRKRTAAAVIAAPAAE
ncbi:MAG: helix-turn-helix transcriptional regulator [Lentisphaeria bacterium]|nr:helix-turn-helix transcriptional regulator [Lentisphaeria bacterium]